MGFPRDWAQVTAEDLSAELAEGGEPVLVDVRTVEEVAESGAVEGAVNLPLEQLIEFKNEWPAQGANIVVYDADGYRGNLAMITLRGYGYENVRNLKGGFSSWVEAGLPTASN